MATGIKRVTERDEVPNLPGRPPYVPKIDVRADLDDYLVRTNGELQYEIQRYANDTLLRNDAFWTLSKDDFDNAKYDDLFMFTLGYIDMLINREDMKPAAAITEAVKDAVEFYCARAADSDRYLRDQLKRDELDAVDDRMRDLDEVTRQMDRYSRDAKRGRRDRDDDRRDRRGSRRDRDDDDDYDGRDNRRSRRDDGRRDSRVRDRGGRSTGERQVGAWRSGRANDRNNESSGSRDSSSRKPPIRQIGDDRSAKSSSDDKRSSGKQPVVKNSASPNITLTQVLVGKQDTWPELPSDFIHVGWDGNRHLAYFNTNNDNGRTVPIFLNIGDCNMNYEQHNNEMWLTTRRTEVRNRVINNAVLDAKLQQAAKARELNKVLEELGKNESKIVGDEFVRVPESIRMPVPIAQGIDTSYHSIVEVALGEKAEILLTDTSVSYVSVMPFKWGISDEALYKVAIGLAKSNSMEEVRSRLNRLNLELMPYYWEELELRITSVFNQLTKTLLGIQDMAIDSFCEDSEDLEEALFKEYPGFVEIYQNEFFNKFKKVALTFDNKTLLGLEDNELSAIPVVVENVLLLPLYSSELHICGVSPLVAVTPTSYLNLYRCLSNELNYLHEQSNYVKVITLDNVAFYAYKAGDLKDVVYIVNYNITTE